MEGHTGSSATCAFLLRMLHGFHGQGFLFRCYKVSALDTILPCAMASCAKQGGGLAFCLMPIHEEAVLRPGPVFPDSVAVKQNLNGPLRKYPTMPGELDVFSHWRSHRPRGGPLSVAVLA